MNRLSGEKVSLGQASGADVELVVEGDNEYASYETTDGFPVVYDDSLGLFCYTALDSGRLLSTGVPMAETPPPSCPRHGRESQEVRREKSAQRQAMRDARARARRAIIPSHPKEET